MSERTLSLKEKIAFGIGAVGKDMVYMLSASYILYYFQDLLGVSAVAMGIILLAARVFDAFNDPIMGVIVGKTKTRWGKFRPWLLVGTLTNAVVLFLMFAAPPSLSGQGLVAYAAITYILWGITYTMMDIPFWSMIPAFTTAGKEREGMSALGRSCAGVGSALITIVTVAAVSFLGCAFNSPEVKASYNDAKAKYETLEQTQKNYVKDMNGVLLNGVTVSEDNLILSVPGEKKKSVTFEYDSNSYEYESILLENGVNNSLMEGFKKNYEEKKLAEGEYMKAKRPVERTGYKWFSLLVSLLFVLFTVIMCITIKEKSTVDMESPGIGEMFKSLFRNDQALIMVVAIVLINTALYTTSNLTIYFFKYDFGGAAKWEGQYTLFNIAGGGFQILAMMVLFPVLRKWLSTMKVFYTSFIMAFAGYIALLAISCSGTDNVLFLLIPAFFIMSAIGMLNVILTIFLANSCDYGELKNGRRDESVIFSMQTFVVKLASGISALIASLILTFTKISELAGAETIQIASASSRMALRMCVTLIPMAVLVVAILVFAKKYKLTDQRMEEIQAQLAARK